jgi:CTP:molybdopterin cytidylyltransferase MocA
VALAGAPVTLAAPAPADHGPVGQIARGIDVARQEVKETDGALLWPARYAWVDPETVTSLIEAHGPHAAELLRPTYADEAGWPVLLPFEHLEALRRLAPDRMPDGLLADLEATGVPVRLLDLGDPGAVHDRDTPREGLPAFEGPPEPPGGHVHEWGSPAALEPDEGPLEGPALAPYEPAGS